jgi:hypothetical protein
MREKKFWAAFCLILYTVSTQPAPLLAEDLSNLWGKSLPSGDQGYIVGRIRFNEPSKQPISKDLPPLYDWRLILSLTLLGKILSKDVLLNRPDGYFLITLPEGDYEIYNLSLSHIVSIDFPIWKERLLKVRKKRVIYLGDFDYLLLLNSTQSNNELSIQIEPTTQDKTEEIRQALQKMKLPENYVFVKHLPEQEAARL